MKAIDSHAHLDFADFNHDREAIITDLQKEGIGIINVSHDFASNAKTLELTRYPHIWGAVGIHPLEAHLYDGVSMLEAVEKIAELADNDKVVAIGEVGLDYKLDKEVNKQKALLIQFINLAKDKQLPMIVHSRDAYGDLSILFENYKVSSGVMHCFGGTKDEAKKFLDMGLHISFTANITYPKNEAMREVVASVPLDRLLIETDCPFMPPQGKRGTRNDPSAVLSVAECIAEIHHLDKKVVLEKTLSNTRKLFNIKL